MKQLIIYESATGKILSAQRKKYDYVDIASGIGTIDGSNINVTQALAGDLSFAEIGSLIFVGYDAVSKMTSKRISKDAEGKTILKGGMPVVEDFFIDMTWKDFVDTVIKAISGTTITLEVGPSKTPEPSVDFRVYKQTNSMGFSINEVAKAIELSGDPSALALKIDSEIDIKHPEWKVDLGTGHLVKISQITYE
jgi:hypothetical protein